MTKESLQAAIQLRAKIDAMETMRDHLIGVIENLDVENHDKETSKHCVSVGFEKIIEELELAFGQI